MHAKKCPENGHFLMSGIARPSFGREGWFGGPDDGNQQQENDGQGVKQFVKRNLVSLLRDALVDGQQRCLAAARDLL